jgi:hypothetical protein
MPAVTVAECETVADVVRLARKMRERRQRLGFYAPTKQSKPGPIPAIEPEADIPEPEVVPAEWLGRSTLDISREMALASRVSQSIDETCPRPLVEQVIKATARAYGFRSTDLKAARRDVPACHARHVSMLLSKLLTLRSYPWIGRMHGNRDHTTVMHAYQKLAWLSFELEALLTLSDPVSLWADTAARLHPIPTMARTYVRRPEREVP